jgi:predicted RNase H-like HicB family nuclease
MKRAFTYTITQEDDLFVAQCLEVDVASQGGSPDEATANLREALELHFEPPLASYHRKGNGCERSPFSISTIWLSISPFKFNFFAFNFKLNECAAASNVNG